MKLIDQLIKGIIEKKSPIVVGLDPRLESIPTEIVERNVEKYGETFKAAAESIYEFNVDIMDAVADLVPAVKPQVAFYEILGVEGMDAYKRTVEYAKTKGLVVIGDIKRGDIGSTSLAYSNAHIGFTEIFGKKIRAFENDFVTINPYLGDDCTKEFIKDIDECDKGIFVLVKTSNPTSSQLQNLVSDNSTIYETVANQVETWSKQRVGEYGYSSIGSVVGATYPEEADTLRDILKTSYFLVPGYGAQGATGKDITNCFDKKGLGAIVNSSRGIIFAYKNKAYEGLNHKEAAAKAVVDMREDINSSLEAVNKKYW